MKSCQYPKLFTDRSLGTISDVMQLASIATNCDANAIAVFDKRDRVSMDRFFAEGLLDICILF
jgi:hypothetical protein